MLLELSVQNLLLIEDARLELAAGLNVITGETGAGKTVLAHALDLLLGGRARPGIVRPGAAEAYVEGVFELPDGFASEHLAADAGELVLARRVGADGRTRAYLGGRSIPVGELRELAGELLVVLRPARAPPPDARAPRSSRSSTARAAPSRRCARAACAAAWTRGARRRARSSSGSPSSPGRASASSTCSSSSSPRSSRSTRTEDERAALRAERDRLRNVEAPARAPRGAPSRRWPTRRRAALRALLACGSSLDAAAALDARARGASPARAQALAIEGAGPAERDPPLRRGARGAARSPRGRRGAPGRDRAARAQARRQRRGGARARRALPRAPRGARRGRGGDGGGRSRASSEAQRAHARPRAALSAARAAGAPALARGGRASGWRSWRWRRRASR